MSDIDGNVRGSRGQKRKLPGDEVKLTFSQRLAAAARKAPKHAEPSSDAESNGVAALSYNSSLRLADSSDVDETPETTHHLEQDDIYRNLYAREIDFAALAEKDVHFRAWSVFHRLLCLFVTK